MRAVKVMCVACLLTAVICGCVSRVKKPAIDAKSLAPTRPGVVAASSPASPGATPLPAIFEPLDSTMLPAEGDGVVIMRWRTGSEIEVSGYNVMRAETPDSAFAAVNVNLIPATGSLGQSATYEYRDRGLQEGRTYYYYLEEVLETGQRRALSQVNPFTASADPESGVGSAGEGRSQ